MSGTAITKRAIEALEPGEKIAFTWDRDVRGFGVRVSPGGTKAFIVQYRDGTKTVRKTLGTYPTMAVDKARKAASDVLAANRLGETLPIMRGGGKPFGEVLDLFIANAEAKKAPRTAADYKARIDRYIRPKFGSKRIGQISRLAIERWHEGMATTPSQANHLLTIVVAVFSYAAKNNLIKHTDHPALGISKYRENKRERYLTLDEVKAFGEALKELEAARKVSPWAAAALRLLALTGARSGEILTLKWDYVNLDSALLDLPTSKTGAKKIKLSSAAVDVLRAIPKVAGVEWVIVGRKFGEPMTTLQRPFGAVCKKAGIEGLRIHDLRHSAASIATSGGVGLPVVGALLGQSQAYTTQRYSHIHDDAERAAAEVIASKVGALVGTSPLRVVK